MIWCDGISLRFDPCLGESIQSLYYGDEYHWPIQEILSQEWGYPRILNKTLTCHSCRQYSIVHNTCLIHVGRYSVRNVYINQSINQELVVQNGVVHWQEDSSSSSHGTRFIPLEYTWAARFWLCTKLPWDINSMWSRASILGGCDSIQPFSPSKWGWDSSSEGCIWGE